MAGADIGRTGVTRNNERFENVYEDKQRAESYAKLEFPGTYYLAFRDIPEIISRHATGRRALDFGCGTGRSTRFLEDLGFEAVGADISEDMLKLARERDPGGDYRLMADGSLAGLPRGAFDLVLSAFTFDNIPTMERKTALFAELRQLLAEGGVIVSIVSDPDIYTHEWASFTTKDFPENLRADTGDPVRIIVTDVEDRRPVVDSLWKDDAYREVYKRAGLEAVAMFKPLGGESEPYNWVSETKIAPWVIYVLRKRVAE